MAWHELLKRHWPALRFRDFQVETVDGIHNFRVQVYLDELNPDTVDVELYAPPRNSTEAARCRLVRGEPLVGAVKAWPYAGQVKADRPASDYTVRIIPRHPEAAIPLEAAEILWQR